MVKRVSTLVACVIGALLWAAPAHANTATVSFLDAAGNSDPVLGVGRAWILSGNSGAPTRVYIKWRPIGGAPCAPSASSDSGTDSIGIDDPTYIFSGDTFNNTQVNGNFALRKTGTWNNPGTFMFCIWFANSASDVATPIRQDITFRAPNAVISGSVAPVSPLVNQAATVTVTGSSEASKAIYATYRLAGGAPCAVSYDADSGRGLINGTSVNGAFSITNSLTVSSPGTYVICIWLAGSSADGVPAAGPQTATFTVRVPCIVPSLDSGTAFTTVKTQLATAGCSLGAVTRKASRRYKRGTLLSVGEDSGTTLAPNSPVAVVLSSGAPCVVPASPSGMTLARAKRVLKSAHCRAGKVTRVKSHRRRNTVVGFSPRRGSTLASQAAVRIRLSRGHR